MRWNNDHISGSPQFLLKPICYLLSRIKSNKSFSPPLNSTWIMLKLNHVESFISFFIPITFPPTPLLRLVQGLFYGIWCSCSIVELIWHTSILLGSVTEAESWSLGLLPGIHICTTWLFRAEEGWRVAPRLRNLLWVHLSVQPILSSSLAFRLSGVETVVNIYLYVVMPNDNHHIWIYCLNVIEKTMA